MCNSIAERKAILFCNNLVEVGGLCHTYKRPIYTPSLPPRSDFVSYNGLRPLPLRGIRFQEITREPVDLLHWVLALVHPVQRGGLKLLPLVGGLFLVQVTLTTKGLNDLPVVKGLCLVQWTSTTMGLK